MQLVDLLLAKVPTLYKPTFRREGVFHEIEVLSSRPVTSAKSKDKDSKDKELSESPAPPDSGSVPSPPVSAPTIPGFKKLSSLQLEPEDAITLRARVIQFKYLSGDDKDGDDDSFDTLRRLVQLISKPTASEKELTEALRELADLFGSPHTSVSSFELLQSGFIDGLLQFATDDDRTCKFISTPQVTHTH